jgi:hypothetical protein
MNNQNTLMPSIRALLSAALACVVSAMAWAADPLDTWHQRDSGTSTNLNAVDYSAEGFVAVGNGGLVGHSEDGANWQRYFLAPYPNLRSVSHNNGLYCAVGDGGHIYTSFDGQAWTARTSPTTNNLLCIRWLNNRFLVGGENGTLLSSLNGADWTVLESGISSGLNALAFGNGLFVAASKDHGDAVPVILSTDAITWTIYPQSYFGTYDLLHHDNVFWGLSIRNQLRLSTNGTNWTMTYRTGNAPHYLTAITRDHGRYVAVGGPYGFVNPRIASSTDGLSWQHHPVNLGVTNKLNGVAAGSFSVVAVGDNGLILLSASTFRILPRPQIIDGVPHWIVHGRSGLVYHLFAASDPTTGPWVEAGKTIATNDVFTIRDLTNPLPPFRFYRVIEE